MSDLVCRATCKSRHDALKNKKNTVRPIINGLGCAMGRLIGLVCLHIYKFDLVFFLFSTYEEPDTHYSVGLGLFGGL
jgi:hypothetical protein